jgi:hypothetical protein
MATTRKNIDFPDDLVEEMDRIKEERHITYNDIIVPALRQYLLPNPTVPTDVLADRLDGTRQALEQIQQRLWNLDSSNQKSTERLAALEAIAQQSMELLILIGERLATPEIQASTTHMSQASQEPAPASTPEPYRPAYLDNDGGRNHPMHTDPTNKWYIPPEEEKKRGWFGRNKS